MKKIIELRNITSIPEFYNEMVLLYRSNTLLFISEKTYDVVHELHFNDWYPLEVSNGIVLMYKNDLFIYDDKLKKFTLYQGSIYGGAVAFFNDKIIEDKYDRKNKSVEVTLYEKNNNDKLWQRTFPERRGSYILGEHLYVTDLSLRYIDFIDDRTGEILNTLHFENPPISRFIYYYNETLIVSLHVSRDEFHLLGLDARTGEEKWRIKDAFYIYAPDYSTGLFYALSGNLFQVVDVKNGRMVCVDDLSSEMSKFNVIPEAGGCLTGDGIYFRGRLSGKFGLLNIHTHKFEFVEDLGVGEGVRTNDIQYHNGKVYILDSMNVLHIWGKE